MQLAEFDKNFFEVRRNGEFETLGTLSCYPEASFLCFAESEKFLQMVCEREDISCVLTTQALCENEILEKSGKGIACCRNPKESFFLLHNWMTEHEERYLQGKTAASTGKHCSIHPTAVIEEGVVIGDNVVIEEHVIVRSGSVVGNHVILHANSVIGAENIIAFYREDGTLNWAKQAGKTLLEDNVVVGYGACVARGIYPYEITIVKAGSCLGDKSMISHTCTIEKNVCASALSQVCGVTEIGENVDIGAAALITNLIHVGNSSKILPGAVVATHLGSGKKVAGNFAVDYDRFVHWCEKMRRV